METSARKPLARPCPRLGHIVRFRYCLRGDPARPCFKIRDCWWETFDIDAYLQDHLSPAQWEALLQAKPPDRLGALVAAAAAARERVAAGGGGRADDPPRSP